MAVRDRLLARILPPLVVAFVAFAAVAMATPALAHADLDSTVPADKDVSTVPVERIELIFTDAVETVGRGVQLLDGDGRDVPASVFAASEATIAIIPDDPLGSGRYAVVWQVESADGHEIPGAISFEVALPDAASAVSDEADDEEVASSDATVTPVASTPTTVVITHSPPAAAAADGTGTIETDAPNTTTADTLGFFGRWGTMLGALLAIGAFAFAATSLVGTRDEVQRSVRWVRFGAVLVLVGTLVEAASIVWADLAGGEALVAALLDLIGSSFGVAVVLRLAGGTAMLLDPLLVTLSPIDADTERSPNPDRGTEPADGARVATRAPSMASPQYRLDPRPEWVALAGVAAVAASFMFDGHTVTADPDVVARVAAAFHVIAGGVWLGGIIVMADTLVRRKRAAIPLDGAAMGVRFSRMATASLLAVGLAGLALTWTIIDTPSDLVSTTWGRLLLVKVALVIGAAAVGAYNHFSVVPGLMREPGDVHRSATLQRTVTIEAVVLIAVVTVTAILVAAAS